MILEIDHIAISSTNLHEHIEFMKSFGYELKFIKSGVNNIQIKRSLLHNYYHKHDIALLISLGNLSIELVNHKNIHKSNDYIIPIFENIDPDLILNQEKKMEMVGTCAQMKLMEFPIYVSNNTQHLGLKFTKFVIMTNSVKKSAKFWGLLGFKIKKILPEFAILEFNALLNKNNYEIFLQKTHVDTKHFLDDSGVNCIALISNNLQHDKKTLDGNGVSTTDIENLVLGDKTFDIFFAKGPSNEIVEIISPNRAVKVE